MGKECVKIEQNEASALKIVFQDGSEALGNILIAADGIHSVIRKQVTQGDNYRYAGYTCWRGVTPANNLSLTNDFIETWEQTVDLVSSLFLTTKYTGMRS